MWYGQEECDEWYVMYEINHVLVIGITTCMSMSMTTGRSHRSCLYFLYDLRVIEERHVNYFTLFAKRISHRSRSSRWRDNFMKTRWWRSWWWRSWCHAGDDDDHGSPKMEIKRSKMILAISCHYLIACDVYHVYASCLLRTTVVNKMIPYNNFKKCSPLTVHRCYSSSLLSTTWWSGVMDSYVHIQRV